MTARSQRIRTFGLAAGLALLVGFVYGQTLRFGFLTYDDDTYVWENPHVLEGLTARNIAWACTTTTFQNWHPLTWLSYLVDVEVTRFLDAAPLDESPTATSDPIGETVARRPLSPRVFHATNVLLQLAATLLLWTFLERSTGRRFPSMLAAAVFAVHPLNVEVVAWISERKELLSTCCGLLSLIAFQKWVVEGSRRAYAGALVAYAGALMSKPMLVTLPFLLLVLDFWPWNRHATATPRTAAEPNSGDEPRANPPSAASPPGRSFAWRLVEKLPFLVLCAAGIATTLVAQQESRAAVRTEILPFAQRVANAVQAPVEYLAHFAWPTRLCVLYPLEDTRLGFGRTAIAAAILVVVTGAFAALARRWPAGIVGWLWFLGSLVPVLGLVQVGSQRMADRYMHWPGLGLTIVVAWAAAEVLARTSRPGLRFALVAGLVCVIGGGAILARNQTRTWQNGVVLFEQALQITERNPIAEAALADAYVHRGFPGDLLRARTHYEAAVRLDPQFLAARISLATTLCHLKDVSRGADLLATIVRENPQHPGARFNWGMARLLQGDAAAAEQIVEEARGLGADPAACERLLRMARAARSAGDRNPLQEPRGTRLREPVPEP